ncbi:U32 family peptidase C-terminal domain-containing protein [Candidatus Peregrinibacteria bacterium]|nr:U32 family peptidase C-terminal domain-containing protein [Candidatus Peregrinibacteria bacterium]
MKIACAKPELILPAGSPEKMDFAYMYGADTVYMGITGFSLRSRVNDFSPDLLRVSIEKAHKMGKKVYVTINVYPHNVKIDSFREHIKLLSKIKPDALIVADPGVFSLIKEEYPDAKIHISVQANCLNYKTVEFWHKMGAKRVVLPRELSLSEIREIHEKVPGIELEAFVHGAICVAYSGRCLMSSYFTQREANQGICAQSCRWKYKVYLEEEKRPGEFMPIEEDDNGTYLFNSKDICALPYLKEMVEAGVQAFKVEGRSKSIYYLSTVASVYRKAINNMTEGKTYDPKLMAELEKIANRGYSPGFLKGVLDQNDIHYEKNEPVQTHKFVGVIRDTREHKSLKKYLYEVEIRNRVEKGDSIEIMTPEGVKKSKILSIYDLKKPEEIGVAHGGAGNKFIELKEKLQKGAFLRKIC